jgi:hypothetical protein
MFCLQFAVLLPTLLAGRSATNYTAPSATSGLQRRQWKRRVSGSRSASADRLRSARPNLRRRRAPARQPNGISRFAAPQPPRLHHRQSVHPAPQAFLHYCWWQGWCKSRASYDTALAILGTERCLSHSQAQSVSIREWVSRVSRTRFPV